MNAKIDITDVCLKTERLILRPWRETDLQDFYEYASVDGVGQMAGWTPHKDLEESRRILKDFIDGKRVFALEHQNKVIGSLGIEEYSEEHYPELFNIAGREIGYVLSKAYWGQGFMPEAVQAVMKYLFHTVKLDFILVGHFDWNRQSARVIEKCGFRYIKSRPFETRYGTVENTEESILYRRHFMAGYTFEDDTALVQEIYRRFDENSRLNKSQAARVEFLTTIRYINRYLTPGARILDVGAGAGEYSLYFSRKGYRVSALELADSNIAAFRAKLTSEDSIDLVQGNALDLSRYPDDSFDLVLLFGPLYHLHREEDKLLCIAEAKRVCKPNGKLFFAFIANDMVILTMFNEVPDYFINGDYDKETFRCDDFPFVFHTVEDCRKLLTKGEVKVLHEVASDGVSELLSVKINAMAKASYEQYLRYHFYTCEKPEHLGASNHLLFVGEK
ncbi:MAG: GNAT family N-acetyltransferase [Erysipelotrichaceae bacterium]|nr:GNAT family N-acetyltransferase [Erysipelotrichaceae bacterium]